MKRLFTLINVLFLLLASCGTPEPSQPSDPTPSDPNEPVLTKRNITLNVWESEAVVPFIERAAEEFRKKYPNIAIRVEAVEPDVAANRFLEGRAADLFAVPHTDVRALADSLDVLPARSQDKLKETVQDSCVQAATVGGVIYGYPVSASTLALFYNKALISTPPATWGGVAEFAATFGGKHGFVFPAGTAYYALPFTTFGYNRLFGADGENAANSFMQTPSAVAGMEIFAGLRSVLNLPASELTAEYAVQAFASGDAAMCIAGTWDIAAFSSIDFGVTQLPAFTEGGLYMAAPVSARVMLVSAWSEQPDEASAFADFLLTDAMQKLRLELTGEIPSIPGMFTKPSYAIGCMKQLESSFAIPTIPEMERFWSGFGDVSARIWDGTNIAEVLSVFNTSIITPDEPEESPEE